MPCCLPAHRTADTRTGRPGQLPQTRPPAARLLPARHRYAPSLHVRYWLVHTCHQSARGAGHPTCSALRMLRDRDGIALEKRSDEGA